MFKSDRMFKSDECLKVIFSFSLNGTSNVSLNHKISLICNRPQKTAAASALIKRYVFVTARQGIFFMQDKNHKRHDNKNIPLNKCGCCCRPIFCIPIHEWFRFVLHWIRDKIVDGVNNKRP